MSIRSGSPSYRSTRSSFEDSPRSPKITKPEIQDDPDEDPRNEEDITFKVTGTARIKIAGATIDCQDAEINILRKKSDHSHAPEGSGGGEVEVGSNHSSRIHVRPRHLSFSNSTRDHSPSPVLLSHHETMNSNPSDLLKEPSAQLQTPSQQLVARDIKHSVRFVASDNVVYEVERMASHVVDDKDKSQPSTSLGRHQEKKRLRDEWSSSPGQKDIAITTIDNHFDDQRKDFGHTNGRIWKEYETLRQPPVHNILPSTGVILSSSPPRPRIRPQSTITINVHSNSDSDNSNDTKSVSDSASAYYDESPSEDSEDWEVISDSSIEPSESASRPGGNTLVRPLSDILHEKISRSPNPNPTPETPHSSSRSLVESQVITSMPPSILNRVDKNNSRKGFLDSGSSFTCTIGTMSAGGNLQFSTPTYPLYGPRSLHSSVSLAYTSPHGPLMIIIDDWRPWYLEHLQTAFPSFPVQSLRSFIQRENVSMLPLINESGELTCITEHISIDSHNSKAQACGQKIQLGNREASCRSVFTWATKFACLNPDDEKSTDHPNHAHPLLLRPLRPLIVLVSTPGTPISDKLTHYYLDSDIQQERWNRLAGDLNWIYLDTYFLFTKWERIWGAVKKNLKSKITERFYPSSSAPILQQTRQLHEDTDTMMSLREHLRIHEASLARFAAQLTPTHSPSAPTVRLKLLARVSQIQQVLGYYNITASSLLDQQSNLMSLSLNLETVSQGQAVARLNVLALIFLPLSFAASIFGMTTFTTSVTWYPVFALPLLVFTIAIAVTVDRVFSKRQVKQVHITRDPVRPRDIESQTPKPINNTSRLASTIKAYGRKTRPNLSAHDAMPEFSPSIARKDMPHELESNQGEKTSLKNQEPIPKTPYSSPIPKLSSTVSLHSFHGLENPMKNSISKTPAMTMIRQAAIKVLRSRSSQTSQSLDPLYTQHSSSQQDISYPNPPDVPLENVTGVSQRNVTFNISDPTIGRSNEFIPPPSIRTISTVKSSSRPYSVQKPSQSDWDKKLSEAKAYQNEIPPSLPQIPLTAEILKERNQSNEASSRAPRDRDGSSHAFSSYSRGESEKGHIPSAFPRIKQPYDSEFKYTVVQRDKDSHEVIRVIGEPKIVEATRSFKRRDRRNFRPSNIVPLERGTTFRETGRKIQASAAMALNSKFENIQDGQSSETQPKPDTGIIVSVASNEEENKNLEMANSKVVTSLAEEAPESFTSGSSKESTIKHLAVEYKRKASIFTESNKEKFEAAPNDYISNANNDTQKATSHHLKPEPKINKGKAIEHHASDYSEDYWSYPLVPKKRSKRDMLNETKPTSSARENLGEEQKKKELVLPLPNRSKSDEENQSNNHVPEGKNHQHLKPEIFSRDFGPERGHATPTERYTTAQATSSQDNHQLVLYKPEWAQQHLNTRPLETIAESEISNRTPD